MHEALLQFEIFNIHPLINLQAGHYDNDRGFHKATRKELRHAADDINMQIENVCEM